MPTTFSEAGTLPPIYPDYTEVVVPPNIAPMNFLVDSVDDVVAQIAFPGGELVFGGEDNKIQMDDAEWRMMLQKAKGDKLTVTVYTEKDGRWVAYKPFGIGVAEEEIDPYISFRVLPPTFVGLEDLAIRQRNITNFEETDIYNNRQMERDTEGQCMNCHSYQNYGTQNMMFHMRLEHPGTMIVRNGELVFVNLKTPEMISAAAYNAWHPSLPFIAFSTDHTMQSFHTRDVTKVEVMESASDLVIYDVEKNRVQTVLADSAEFELFPSWSPDGKWLYFCSAHYEYQDKYENTEELLRNFRQLQYNIYRIPSPIGKMATKTSSEMAESDKNTKADGASGASKRFMPPSGGTWASAGVQLIYDAVATDHSAVQPRVSADGRYVMFAEGPWGLFHIWHPTADIQILDTETGQLIDTKPMNSERAESYPSWSSNGRWILFESRREDGNYTRSYFAYFDKQGHLHKPFAVPEYDPIYFRHLLKSWSRPEFMKEPVSITPEQFRAKCHEDPIDVGD